MTDIAHFRGTKIGPAVHHFGETVHAKDLAAVATVMLKGKSTVMPNFISTTQESDLLWPESKCISITTEAEDQPTFKLSLLP